MTETQKIQWLQETYKAFLTDLNTLSQERLKLMKKIVHRIEKKKIDEVRTTHHLIT